MAELQGNSALSGGAGAVVGEVAADIIRKQLYGKEVKDLTEEEKQTISALSQLAAGLAVAAGGGSVGDAGAAINSSKNAVENNYLSVNEAKRKAYLTWIKPNYLGEELTEDEKKELENLNKLDKERDQILQDNCSLGNISSSACKGLLQEAWEMQNEYEKEVARSLTNADLYREDSKNLNEALVGLDPNSIIHLISIEAIAKETGRDVKDVAQQYKYVMAAHGIVSSLAGLYEGVNFTQPNTNKVKGNVEANVDASGKARESSNFREHVNKEREVNASRQTENTSSTPIINPATNKPVTDHIIVSSGKAPQTSTPNSIYEVSRADGSRSITYYDEKGNWFSREDYGQLNPHGEMRIGSDGRVVSHEHKRTYKNYNGNIYKDKDYYRRIDKDGKPIGDWILDK
ncbi:VENN motif pre-toxin domain-containing protein [Gilliamella sp. N-W3]|uniref:VENN motif pre-toxin domain-containing protein n=1 Tax=Gilliamella sp. N-W3 TaxID=1970474 RepID=UPI001C1FDCD7|nr:VENN motif pre-toxin domain-containing protein [Gilliamella sp. N-W3]